MAANGGGFKRPRPTTGTSPVSKECAKQRGIPAKLLLGMRILAVYFVSLNVYLCFFSMEELPIVALTPSQLSAGSSALVASLAVFLNKTKSGDQDVQIENGSDGSDISSIGSISRHVTFPFYLSCPGPGSFPPGNYDIALLYSVDMVNNWEEILRDQLHTLIKCGLWGRRTASFMVTARNSTGGGIINHQSLQQLGGMLSEYEQYTHGGAQPQVANSDQQLVANFITNTCSKDAALQSPTFLFHFNTLGASSYDPTWRIHEETKEPLYTKTLYYRKYIEHYTLERPETCIRTLLDGSWSCGVDLQRSGKTDMWYGGNYWAASCNYLSTLPTPTITDGSIPSNWIGTKPGLDVRGKGGHKGVVKSFIRKVDESMRMIYPEQYDANATRFHLACGKDMIPPGNYNLAMVYHVGMLGNWREVVEDQLNTLSACGLGKRAKEWIVTYSGGKIEDLISVLDTYRDRITPKPQLIESLQSPWEGEAMNSTRLMCLDREAKDEDPTYVFYFHNKGVSRYRETWKNELHRRSYGQVLYWRKFMEYYTIERPSRCVNAILDGASTCGSKFRWVKGQRHVGRYHYSGNFWAASCSFLASLPPLTETDYYAGEFWVGEGMPFELSAPLNSSRFVNLHHETTSWRNNPSYTHLILPEEYVDVNLIDDAYTSVL